MAQGFFELIGQAYLVLAAIVIGVAVWLPRTSKAKVASALCAAVVVSMPFVLANKRREETKKVVAQEQTQVKRAAERFAELCKGAGDKINRTVDDVDAVMLLKVRPKLEWKDYADPLLPGAAMAGERDGDSYIETFLGVESHDRGYERGGRGSIGPKGDSPLPRYRYVEAIEPKDGLRYRYTSVIKRVEFISSSNGKPSSSMQSVLERQPASGPTPRYAVDYEDIVNPEDRKLWIAGTTIRVLDQQTGEILGEYITYLMDGGMGTTDGTRAPWSHASHSSFQCPHVDGATSTHTRYFVDRVLKLKKGE